MKKTATPIILIICFFAMLSASDLTKASALKGLNLWLFTLVPTLLPFMIISSVIMETGSYKIITFFMRPIMTKLFHLDENSGYPLFMGLLCGFPMGSKITADMVSKGYLSVHHGNILITFCNNISPAFIIGYMISHVLGLSGPDACVIIAAMFLGPIISGIIMSRLLLRFFSSHSCDKKAMLPNTGERKETVHGFAIIDVCILKSFENIIKLGGYIIIFTIICGMITPFIDNEFFNAAMSGILEITSGLNSFSSIRCDKTVILTVCVLTSFGGLCSIAQTYSMINRSGLSLKIYILGKLAGSLVTFILVSMCLYFIKFL